VPNIVKDTGGDILLVSQFTLQASTKKQAFLYQSKQAGDAIPIYEK
jgi:D-Tyr-tRNAtyr deacylase